MIESAGVTLNYPLGLIIINPEGKQNTLQCRLQQISGVSVQHLDLWHVICSHHSPSITNFIIIIIIVRVFYLSTHVFYYYYHFFSSGVIRIELTMHKLLTSINWLIGSGCLVKAFYYGSGDVATDVNMSLAMGCVCTTTL